jgi:hypothetical protein
VLGMFRLALCLDAGRGSWHYGNRRQSWATNGVSRPEQQKLGAVKDIRLAIARRDVALLILEVPPHCV